MDNKKRKFITPEVEIVYLNEEDIITTSDFAKDTINWENGGGDDDNFLA